MDESDHDEMSVGHEPGTTASEFDGAFDVDDDEEDEEALDGAEDESQSESDRDSRKVCDSW